VHSGEWHESTIHDQPIPPATRRRHLATGDGIGEVFVREQGQGTARRDHSFGGDHDAKSHLTNTSSEIDVVVTGRRSVLDVGEPSSALAPLNREELAPGRRFRKPPPLLGAFRAIDDELGAAQRLVLGRTPDRDQEGQVNASTRSQAFPDLRCFGA
jgi:hypothetical protein